MRLIDAALEQFAILGMSRTSATDIARRAGVDRGTIYRRLGNLDAVVRTALTVEASRLISRIRDAIEPIEEPAERFVRAFVVTVQIMRTHPILVRALEVDKAHALLTIANITDDVIAAAVAFVIEEVDKARTIGHVTAPADVRATAELLVRFIHSMVLYPTAPPILTTDEDLANFARGFVKPLLDR